MIKKKFCLIQILSIFLFCKVSLYQNLLSKSNYQEQLNVQEQEPHYPSKIFIQSEKGFKNIVSQNSSVEVLYFSENNNDNYFVIIFLMKPSQQYQGVKFRINYLYNKLVFLEDLLTKNLNFLTNRFGIKQSSQNFNQHYQNITQKIKNSYEFQEFLKQNNEYQQEQLIGNNSSIDMIQEQLLAFKNQYNQQTNTFDNIDNQDNNISSTILGTRDRTIRDISYEPQQQNIVQGLQQQSLLSQFNLEQRIELIPKRKTLSALLPGISSWSLIKTNEMEFQIFLNHLKMVVQESQDQYLEKNLSLLFDKYNLSLKNMTQFEIQELKDIIQKKIFQQNEAQTYLNRQSATRQMQYLFGQGYDFLISTFLHILKGGKQISQSEAVQLIEYTLKYGKTDNLSYNEELQNFFKDVISIMLIGKPNSPFISVAYDIMKQNRKPDQLIIIMQSNQPNMSLEDYIKKEKQQQFQKKHKINKRNDRYNDQNRYRNKNKRNHHKDKKYQKKDKKENKRKKENEKMVYVSNLPCNVKLTELNLIFKGFGKITKLNCFWKDKQSDQLSCQIEYDNIESAKEAIKGLDGIEIDNKPIKIN